jgi:flagellar export protein FliJ
MNDARKLNRFINIKERLRDVRRAELAEVNAALREAEAKVDEAERQRLVAIESLTSGAEMTANELAQRARLVSIARNMASAARESAAEVESEQTVRQGAVVEANREVKVLEVLQARLKKRAAQEEVRREQGESDNAASRIGGEQ